MKTFYIVKHTVTEDIKTVSIPFATTILAEAVAYLDKHFPYADNHENDYANIRRFVESYELNPDTDTWEVVTEERPVVLYPTVNPKPLPEPFDSFPNLPFI